MCFAANHHSCTFPLATHPLDSGKLFCASPNSINIADINPTQLIEHLNPYKLPFRALHNQVFRIFDDKKPTLCMYCHCDVADAR